jgi:hypothetical protein
MGKEPVVDIGMEAQYHTARHQSLLLSSDMHVHTPDYTAFMLMSGRVGLAALYLLKHEKKVDDAYVNSVLDTLQPIDASIRIKYDNARMRVLKLINHMEDAGELEPEKAQ